MTRRLLIVRHAKSAWDEPGQPDHARLLNERGREEAPRLARRLCDLGWAPDRVLSSDAVRALETWALMAGSFPGRPMLTVSRGLYDVGFDALREELSLLPDDVATAMAIGHNPHWEEALAEWTGLHIELKTAMAALLEGEGSWQTAVGQRWELVGTVVGKED